MSLAKLKKLIHPPRQPAKTGAPKLWAAFERKIGNRLPARIVPEVKARTLKKIGSPQA
jgi:hypothetical protein